MALGDPSLHDERRQHREASTSLRLKSQQLLHALSTLPLSSSLPLAAETLSLLRAPTTSSLSPRSYYDLYLMATAALRPLNPLLCSESDVLPYYELVQQTQYVLPRLYLLITVGAAYVQSGQAPAKSVMSDLVEMCAGVQHPVRGLFLRSYLNQMMKDKLPDRPRKQKRATYVYAVDKGTRGEGRKAMDLEHGVREVEARSDANGLTEFHARVEQIETSTEESEEYYDGDVEDSIEFVIRNLTEMNRLWVRLANSTTTFAHRYELRLLVGSSLATLARFTSLDESLYAKLVFPLLSAQIVSCSDPMAQEYLCDCVISCFPPSFHLVILDEFLVMCGTLASKTNLRPILTTLIDRIPSTAEALTALTEHVPRIVMQQENSVRVDRLLVYLALLKFVIGAEEAGVELIDKALGFAAVDVQRESGIEEEDEEVIVEMLLLSVQALRTMEKALQLKSWLRMREYLSRAKQEAATSSLLRDVKDYSKCVADAEILRRLLSYVKPLIYGHEDNVPEQSSMLSPHHQLYFPMYNEKSISEINGKVKEQEKTGVTESSEEEPGGSERLFEDRQRLVARCVFFVDDRSAETSLGLFKILHDALSRGGSRRIVLTYPSLISAATQLCLKVSASSTLESNGDRAGRCARIIHFTMECISELEALDAVKASGYYLEAALAASSAAGLIQEKGSREMEWESAPDLVEYVYTCISRAFLMYEEGIVGCRDELRALKSIIASVVMIGQSSASRKLENWDALQDRATKHVKRLLTRGDQCVGYIACADLFYEDVKRVAWCLEHAAETALRCANAGDRLLFMLDALAAGVRLSAVITRRPTGKDEVMAEVLHKLIRGARKLLVAYYPQDGALMRVARARFDRALGAARMRDGLESVEWEM